MRKLDTPIRLQVRAVNCPLRTQAHSPEKARLDELYK